MIFLDPHLLIPQGVPPIPMIVDLCLHLFPALFLWTDFLVFNVEFERSTNHVINIYLFAVAYYLWTLYCFSRNEYYAYPFLDKMSTAGILGFYAASGTTCWIMYEFGRLIMLVIFKVVDENGSNDCPSCSRCVRSPISSSSFIDTCWEEEEVMSIIEMYFRYFMLITMYVKGLFWQWKVYSKLHGQKDTEIDIPTSYVFVCVCGF